MNANKLTVITSQQPLSSKDEQMNQFMIQDELLDIAIEKADHKERIELLKRKEEIKRQKIIAYQKAIQAEINQSKMDAYNKGQPKKRIMSKINSLGVLPRAKLSPL